MKSILSTLLVVTTTWLACSGLYTIAVWGIAQAVTPESADGSLVYNTQGEIVGSSLVAQSFTQPGYFWPRPSAVDYNGAGAGGSNLSPTNPALTERAQGLIERYGVTADAPLPPDLVTASGSGLDPHISLAGALYQVPRVAAARQMPEQGLRELVETIAETGGLSGYTYVNVLELNQALDQSALPSAATPAE